MLTDINLVDRTQEFAESLLRNLPDIFVYHDLTHTRSVVEAARLIGERTGLTEEELENAVMAAWLHDIGYASGCEKHEESSVRLARPFLEKLPLGDARIQEIMACILATRLPQAPESKTAEVVCDADLFHLSTPQFFERSELMRQEIKSLIGKLNKKKWTASTLRMMENHHYFTDYGKTVLTPLKEKNLEKVRKRMTELETEEARETAEAAQVEAAPKAEGKKLKRPDRGIETMFRVTSQNHFQLSAMADNKANIMISVNTIIISVIVSILIRKLEEWPQLVIPTVMLTLSCLLATIFAILATRPNVTSGMFAKEDIYQKRANLLFFGNFHKMKLADYEWGMNEMMKDADFLYSSMTRDIYYLGKVLGKKYKLLRIAYTTFMFGFAASVLAFGIAAYFFPVK
ncbi:Pycsar system effector family protein [Larkinella soli]|uniref:Pycsar system effector family protein n=1 Tax=Larkinella soli TaxID=1770527 RepID=UPI000FFCA642|nr:Pycsar system effector family protein [Larkinella soli]